MFQGALPFIWLYIAATHMFSYSVTWYCTMPCIIIPHQNTRCIKDNSLWWMFLLPVSGWHHWIPLRVTSSQTGCTGTGFTQHGMFPLVNLIMSTVTALGSWWGHWSKIWRLRIAGPLMSMQSPKLFWCSCLLRRSSKGLAHSRASNDYFFVAHFLTGVWPSHLHAEFVCTTLSEMCSGTLVSVNDVGVEDLDVRKDRGWKDYPAAEVSESHCIVCCRVLEGVPTYFNSSQFSTQIVKFT